MNAALLQASITICFIVIGGGFRSLINFSVVASWAFYFLTVSMLSVFHGHRMADIYTGSWAGYSEGQGAHVRATLQDVDYHPFDLLRSTWPACY